MCPMCMQANPPCQPMMRLIYEDPQYIKKHLVKPDEYNSPDFVNRFIGKQSGGCAMGGRAGGWVRVRVRVWVGRGGGEKANAFPQTLCP